jgi:lipopolysaccharide/colanic/teichoic acid biosynthesis glycosyltransferase
LSQPRGSVIVVGTGTAAAALADAARVSGWAVDEPMAARDFLERRPAATRVLLAPSDLTRAVAIDVAWSCLERQVEVWLDVAGAPALQAFLPARRLADRTCVTLRPPQAVSLARRVFDVLNASAGLLVLLPLLALIAIAVKLSSAGPVLHRAEVVGEDGRRFPWYKFRTMRLASDDETQRRARFAEYVRGSRGPTKIIDADRVTAIGRWLRRHSLDELPQLWSVLKGDMTLVGPRPCLVYEYELLQPWHRRRFAVRPGLTGLWQVGGRGRVHADDMAFMDICYALARTWRSDLRILWETIAVVLTGRGAA